ncbi:PCI domain-containing protein [Xylariomycetidae sp. FL0641]|nr:PCI domain-containing protein [Xylariomycetidae sp. FL0641]
MPCQKVSEALAQAQSSPDQTAAFNSILTDLNNLSAPETVEEDLKAVMDAVFASNLGIVAQRGLLGTFTTTLGQFKNADLSIAVGGYVLELLSGQASATSFTDHAAAVRDLVATGHEQNEDFVKAANVLAEQPLDSAQRKVTDEERVRVWVRMVRDYLEEDDTTSAATYVGKLKNVMHTVADPGLHLHFKLSQARIQDARREFLPASAAYHDISFSPAVDDEDERLYTLGMAAKCAILAPAGPQRRRALARLYRDERAPQLAEFGVLERMFLDRLLAPDEVAKFAGSLAPHQRATTADGQTVLAKAVVEHNLLGASRLYSNIGFAALGELLGLDAARAEETTARMIEQGRLAGRIDQLEQVIWFEAGEPLSSGNAAAAEKGGRAEPAAVGREMRRWDANVQGLAEEVENVTNALQREFPDFVAANLDLVV